MSIHSTPMDQKIQKDWADVMQQFEVPSSEDGTSIVISDDVTEESSSTKSKVLTVSVALAVSMAIGLTGFYATNTDKVTNIAESINKSLTTDHIVSVKNIVKESEFSARSEPKYITITREFPMNSLETLAADEEDILTSSSESNWKTHTVDKNQALSTALTKAGISKKTLSELNQVKDIKSALEKVSAGYIIRAEKEDDGSLKQLVTHEPGSTKSFVISKTDNSTYKGQLQRKVIETRQTRVTLFIKNSLRYDANQEGIPQEVVKGIIKIFNRDVNLSRDLAKGDRVTLVYEEVFHQGNKIADGDILAAELMHKKRAHRAIKFVQADGKIDYFDDQGYDLSNAFKRHPLVSYNRISSGFGMRKHPIAKRIRMHTGVDFAAPKDTPVFATGNGVVKHVARKGGYGKTIIIEHNDGYSTLYGHLNRYEKGLKPGNKVYIGDQIGYVGSTGQSTGNHLHYEFRVNGAPKNPLKVKLPKALSLTKTERKKFKEDSHNLIRQLDVLQRFAEEKVDITTGIGG